MGEFERELIRERVRAGLRNARAKGRSWPPSRGQIGPDNSFRVADNLLRIPSFASHNAVFSGLGQRFDMAVNIFRRGMNTDNSRTIGRFTGTVHDASY
jgi:hypothetical protein